MVSFGFFLPPSGQLCSGDRFNHVVEQSPDRDAQYGSHSFKHVDCDVFRTALDPANVGPIDIGREGQTFLRKPLLDAQASQIRTDGLPGVHTDAPKHCHGLTGDGLSVPYCAKSHGVEEPMRQVCLPPSAALVRPMTIAALIAALLATSTLATTAQSEGPLLLSMLDEYSGWWASVGAPEACEVTGSPHRVSFGRYEIESGGIIRFGKGDLRMATPSGDCELYEPEFIDGKIEAIAICRVEGERQVGRAVVFGQTDEIELRSPLLRAELVRCGSPAATSEVSTTGQLEKQPQTAPQPVQAPVATGSRPSPQRMANPLDPVQTLEALSGYWRYDDAEFGCTDSDGQTRISLGRNQLDDDWKLVASDGPMRFGFYDGECEFTDPVFLDGHLTATAMCTAEGEAYDGGVTIEALGETSIVVTSPVLKGANLVACEPGQMAGIAALPQPALASSNDNHEGSADAGSVLSAPIVESSPQPDRYIGAASGAVAHYLNPQRNALAKVLADYCQPDFFQYNHWGDGKWDAAFYDRYKQQLLVRYLSNCVQMHSSEFLPFTVMDDMLARNPNLFPAGQAALPVAQAQAVGFYLQMRNMADLEQCVFGPKEQVDRQLDQGLAALLSRATRADQFAVAQGYQAADGMVKGLPLPVGDGPNCTARPMILPLLTQLAFTSGAFIPRTYGN